MRAALYLFFITHLLSLFAIAGEGFARGTRVLTPTGIVAIEQLSQNDFVYGKSSNGQLCKRRIMRVQHLHGAPCIVLRCGDYQIVVAAEQKFYIPHQRRWISAIDLSPGTQLTAACSVESVTTAQEKIDVTALTVEGHHFYLEGDVLVHNTPAYVIPLCAANVANPVVVVAGTLAISAMTVRQLYGFISGLISRRGEHGGGGGQEGPEKPDFDRGKGPGGGPNDPKDFDKHNKNRTFWDNFKKSLEYGTTKKKLDHFFDKPMHRFNELLNKMGGEKNLEAQKKLVEQVLKELIENDRLVESEKFKDVSVSIAGYVIYVRGVVQEGIIKIGTMFIPS